MGTALLLSANINPKVLQCKDVKTQWIYFVSDGNVTEINGKLLNCVCV